MPENCLAWTRETISSRKNRSCLGRPGWRKERITNRGRQTISLISHARTREREIATGSTSEFAPDALSPSLYTLRRLGSIHGRERGLGLVQYSRFSLSLLLLVVTWPRSVWKKIRTHVQSRQRRGGQERKALSAAAAAAAYPSRHHFIARSLSLISRARSFSKLSANVHVMLVVKVADSVVCPYVRKRARTNRNSMPHSLS